MAESVAVSALTTPNQLTSPDPDFRVEKKQERSWRISLLSPRARHWFEANFAEASREARVLETNLAGANAFIRKARNFGFTTEYIGPIAKSYF
ncbi:hypothetical protein I6F26_30485 [Ensifer sp. IC3342]|nr:hypothetical protein [Ensifer sp. BRP08]MCA1450836.1 hypothetical protein [Ensifer sp. IC3342]